MGGGGIWPGTEEEGSTLVPGGRWSSDHHLNWTYSMLLHDEWMGEGGWLHGKSPLKLLSKQKGFDKTVWRKPRLFSAAWIDFYSIQSLFNWHHDGLAMRARMASTASTLTHEISQTHMWSIWDYAFTTSCKTHCMTWKLICCCYVPFLWVGLFLFTIRPWRLI